MLPSTCAACGSPMRALDTWLVRCGSCGFMASSLEAGPGTGIEGLEDLRRANFELLLQSLEPLGGVASKTMLEVGCARGWFLEAARRRGAIVRGIEPEAANAAIARAAGFEVEVGLFPEQLSHRGPYDIVVFNDVLEHIPRPASVMLAVEQLLSPGGLAVINLPSSNGALFRIARLLSRLGVQGPHQRMWQMGFPSPHISYFSPTNLRLLVEGHTGLVQVAAFRLPSVERRGLWPRIRSSHPGIAGAVLFAGVFALSFGLAWLPADIHVGVFKKPAT